VFGAVEINSTFRKRHRRSTFERWRDTVPDHFRFAVKLPEAITHEAQLAACKVALCEFVGDVLGLGRKLGPLLVQLPASAHFDRRRARTFFQILRELHGGSVACEPRHASWYTPRVADLLLEYDVARVVADPPRPALAASPAGAPSLLYVRLHGSPRTYWSAYDDARLAHFRGLIAGASDRTEAWCIFDNTAAGAATLDALRFRESSTSTVTEAF
jgi:uncharacterized protein YecE (DUF72 family)